MAKPTDAIVPELGLWESVHSTNQPLKGIPLALTEAKADIEQRPRFDVAYFLASIICLGWLVVPAYWFGKGSVAFAILSFVFAYFGRRIGWRLSKLSLYGDPWPAVLVECVVWGCIVAYLMHLLIVWQQPNTVVKWIFGFAQGAYIAVPNFGLFMESTIPPWEMRRHNSISNLPCLSYIICSIVFAYIL